MGSSFTPDTVKVNISFTLDVPSLAETVIVEVPSPTSLMVKVVPDKPTVTTVGLELDGVRINTSPSGSVNTAPNSIVVEPKCSSIS